MNSESTMKKDIHNIRKVQLDQNITTILDEINKGYNYIKSP